MTEPTAWQEVKKERESRLRWQSQLLLAGVLSFCALGLAFAVFSARTPATAEGLAICAAFGALVWLLHAATPPAAATGFLLTSCMYLGTVGQPNGSWRHTALLPGLALFVLAFLATRLGRRKKEQRGLAESRHGRGASQVAANMGAAAMAALLIPGAFPVFLFSPGSRLTAPILNLAAAAALAEAAADTVSSEIGQAFGGTPVLLTGWKPVSPGADGAISFVGTATGGLAAAVLVLVAVPTLGLDPRQAFGAWLAALCGFFADSLIGATLERRGWLNNDSVNFLSTAFAALLAWGWCRP